jgi:hypothetical protein
MEHLNNSVQSQRERLLVWLRKRPISTIEARKELDVIHSPARVYELRREGFNVVTHWSYEENQGNGTLHRVAKYVLLPGVYKEQKK